MILIYINNQEINVKQISTIYNAALTLNIQIPTFCYNEKETIAGNCRMCLVEVKGLMKLVASCAFNISEGMEIFTETPVVKQARESILEFLLINHPLDCPICDQGGECDLQDLTLYYGKDRGRFYYIKRAVSDISLGLLVTTSFNRCIQCTKCVRFLDEIAHYNKLGMVGRSKMSMIEKFIDKKEDFQHELLSNIVDICPVGALTSKNYNFRGRKWELQIVESVDIFDSLGANIYIETRELMILRILPKINYLLNEEWLSDKTRYNFDGFLLNCIQSPCIMLNFVYTFNFNNKNYILKKKFLRFINWDLCFLAFKEDVLYSKNLFDMQFIFGNECSLELLVSFKQFYHLFNLSGFYSQNFIRKNIIFDFNYSFFKLPSDIEFNDLILIVGSNITLENTLLSIKLRKAIQKGARIFNIGCTIDSLNNVNKLGNNLDTFFKILQGKHFFCYDLINAKNPLILLSSDRDLVIDSFSNHFLRSKMYELSSYISYLSLCEIGVLNLNLNTHLYYTINADELIFTKNKKNYIIYQGTHFDFTFNFANLIIPSNLFIEEEQFYFNLLNQVVKTLPIKLPKVSEFLFQFSYKFLEYIIQFFYPLFQFNFTYCFKDYSFKFLNYSYENLFVYNFFHIKLQNNLKINLNFGFINNIFSNFYLSDSISRNSILMRKLSLKNNYYIK